MAQKKAARKPAAKKSAAAKEPRYADGVGAAVTTNSDLAQRMEKAMSDAAAKAQADGISDQEEVKRLMMVARDRVKRDAEQTQE